MLLLDYYLDFFCYSPAAGAMRNKSNIARNKNPFRESANDTLALEDLREW